MDVQLVPITQVKPYDRNPRKNEAAVEVVARSKGETRNPKKKGSCMNENTRHLLRCSLYIAAVCGAVLALTIGLAAVLSLLAGRSLAADARDFIAKHFVGAQPVADANLIVRAGYAASFDYNRRATTLVAFHITEGSLNAPKREKKFATFRVDGGVSPVEYNGTGYERGHMMPWALAGVDADGDGKPAGEDKDDHDEAMELNLMTNIVPQSRAVNGPTGIWYRLEKYIQGTMLPKYKEMWIYVGAIYGPGKYDEIGKRGGEKIEVAPLFYMIAVYRNTERGSKRYEYKSTAWLIPHVRERHDFNNEVIGEARVSIDMIEALTGLDFFDGVKIDEAFE